MRVFEKRTVKNKNYENYASNLKIMLFFNLLCQNAKNYDKL